MVELIINGNNPLAIAVRKAAYSIPLIDLNPAVASQRELILARYARAPVSGNFKSREIGNVAMWADCISEIPHEMYNITGSDISHLVCALQVVRLGTPVNFDIGSLANHRDEAVRSTEIGPLKKANGGNEFTLKFDIEQAQVAEIPMTIMNGKFVIDTNANYRTPSAIYPKLQSATYTVTVGHHGMIECLIT